LARVIFASGLAFCVVAGGAWFAWVWLLPGGLVRADVEDAGETALAVPVMGV
jgi:hypothetical protein